MIPDNPAEGEAMKALTICQPYAHLICLPDDDDRAKRVENRTWPTSYRGPLLIHAGKSREWLELNDSGDRDELYDLALADMQFGFIIGIADLRDCVEKFVLEGNAPRRFQESSRRRWPWLEMHEHAEGPWCWVLQEVRRFETPIPYKGAQGLFNVPRKVVESHIQGTTP